MRFKNTPFKGDFMRFNGFSDGGWYQYTTFLFRRLKSPENALKRSLSLRTLFWYLKSVFKTSFNGVFRTVFIYTLSALNRYEDIL
jgi:hypothetical protein